MELALGAFALAYSGLVLFVLANALRKVVPPMRAALAALAISVAVHGTTTAFAGEDATLALGFWGIPHLLLLPVLLSSARRQETAA